MWLPPNGSVLLYEHVREGATMAKPTTPRASAVPHGSVFAHLALDRAVGTAEARAMSRHDGTVLADLGFLLITFTGVWLVAAQMPIMKFPKWRAGVAGVALAAAGVLLIVATSAGHFGGGS